MKTESWRSRTLSILLTAAMVFALLPAFTLTARAQTENIVSTAALLRTATSAGGTGDIVKLGASINITDVQDAAGLVIGRDLTLDLNSQTLTITLGNGVGQTSNGIKINTGMTLTIIDSGTGGSLDVTNLGRSPAASAGFGAGINVTGATLKINSGTVNSTGGYGGAGIGGGKGEHGGNIFINGGIVNAESWSGAAAIGSGTSANGLTLTNVTITGGIVKAIGGMNATAIGQGTININGGTVIADTDNGIAIGSFAFNSSASRSIFNMNGNAVVFASSSWNTLANIISEQGGSRTSGILFAYRATVGGFSSSWFLGTSVTPTNSFTIPSERSLTVPSGSTLTVKDGVTLTNSGAITNSGRIIGTIGGNIVRQNVTSSISNTQITNVGTNVATHGTAWSGVLTANTGYLRPTNITMTIGGVSFAGFSYDSGTGAISVPAADVTGHIAISGTAAAQTFSVNLDRNSGTTGAESFKATFNATTLGGYTAPSFAGYTFNGYFTEASGGVMVINTSGALVANVPGFTNASRQWIRTETPTTLYAQWTANLAGAVAITGDAIYGSTLTANTDGITSPTPGALTYQWIRNGSTNIGTSTTYVLTALDIDAIITVRVSAANYAQSLTSPATGQIGRKQLTINNVAVNNKIFDGNNNASFINPPALVGVINSDAVTLTPGTPTFARTNVENNIPINFTPFSISGEGAGNYTLVQPFGVTADINPATPGSITQPTAQNSITFGTALSGITLTGGEGAGNWAWSNGTATPTVATTQAEVTFTPTDTVNYDWTGVTGWDAGTSTVKRMVTISVTKNAPTINTPPTAGNIYKGAALSTSIFSGGSASVAGTFTWTKGAQTVTTTGSFGVTFNPTDTANYSAATTTVNITTVIDRDALGSKLFEANDILSLASIGTGNGQFPQAAYDIFYAAIGTAQGVFNRLAAENSQADVDNAETTLQGAITTFNNARITIYAGTLLAEITTAQQKLDGAAFGDRNGDYHPAQEALLEAAIEVAQAIADKPDRTNDEVIQASLDLRSAINDFDATLVEVNYHCLYSLIGYSKTLHANAVEGDGNGQYAIGSKDIFEAAIEAAELVAANKRATQAQVNDARETLYLARSAFLAGVVGVIYDALLIAIGEAEELVNTSTYGDRNGDFPLSAKDALEIAIGEAQDVADNSTASQLQIDNAVIALETVIDIFINSEIAVNYQYLYNLLQTANNAKALADEGNGDGQHPTAAMLDFQTAIDTVQGAADDKRATQAEVNTALGDLTIAISAFNDAKIIVDFAALDGKIGEAEGVIAAATVGTGNGQFLQAAYDLFEVAIESAKTVRTTPKVTQAAVDGAVTTLHGAIDTFNAAEIVTHTITYNANGGTGTMTGGKTAHGAGYVITANGFTNSGHSFTGWNTAANGSGTPYAAGATIPNVQGDITLYAQWNRNNTGGGGSWTSPAPQQTAPATGGTNVNYTQSGGNVTLSLPSNTVTQIINNANAGDGVAYIDLSDAAGVTNATMPRTALTQFANAGLDIKIQLPQGTITIDNNAAKSAATQANGTNVTATLQPLRISDIPVAQRENVRGSDLIFRITVGSGTQNITTFGEGTITVTIPYTGPLPAAAWHLNSRGELERMDSVYCTETKTVTFTTSHLSLFTVGFDENQPIIPDDDGKDKPEAGRFNFDISGFVNPYADIRDDAWYYDVLAFVYLNELMTGTSTEPMLFSPQMTVTRGMVATVLYRIAGSSDVSGLANPFSDVADGLWYTNAVIWAANNGIVSGIGGGRFAPERNITRQEMAVMFNNYAVKMMYALPEARDYAGFNDEEDIAGWAREAVERLFGTGVISGKHGNIFDPQGEATRAELAAMLTRSLDAIIPREQEEAKSNEETGADEE